MGVIKTTQPGTSKVDDEVVRDKACSGWGLRKEDELVERLLVQVLYTCQATGSLTFSSPRSRCILQIDERLSLQQTAPKTRLSRALMVQGSC